MVIHEFQALPGGDPDLRRPTVPVAIQGLAYAEQQCLIDTGSVGNRFGSWVAELAGIDLAGLEPEPLGIGGARVLGRTARVGLVIGEYTWEAPVSFCDPWPFAFQLLGQEGFLRYFDVRLRTAHYTIEIEPEAT